MKLTKNQIEEVVIGAVSVEQKGDKINFHRFTEEQAKMYGEYKDGRFLDKVDCPAGVRLVFNTDSKKLKLKGVATKVSRGYYSIDVVVNDEYLDCITNITDSKEDFNLYKEYPVGDFEKSFDLGEGEKKVEVYLPFSFVISFEEIELDDGSFIKPIKAQKKGLLFGDSITQGYDSIHPTKHHTAVLSKFLDTDFINKAIGGEYFNPLLAKTKDDIDPDYILIAYGTNDWTSGITLETLTNNCKEFCQNVRNNYPKAKVFILSPVWRKDKDERQLVFDFMMVSKTIEKISQEVGNIIFIDGYDFVPHDSKYFADEYLHPNQAGFEYYAKNLCDVIKDKI